MELQSALILRAKASSLLMAIVSEGQPADADQGISFSRADPPSGMSA